MNIKAHPIFGYGIDGILLHTFWTEWSGGGFNYAHNQILQNLLDGGVMLTISFWIMIFAFIKPAKKIPEVKYRVFVNSSIIALLFVMIFDSTTCCFDNYTRCAFSSHRKINKRKMWQN